LRFVEGPRKHFDLKQPPPSDAGQAEGGGSAVAAP
jgi:hypothetical protein